VIGRKKVERGSEKDGRKIARLLLKFAGAKKRPIWTKRGGGEGPEEKMYDPLIKKDKSVKVLDDQHNTL